MLEKTPGNYTVENLRVLLLLYADFNGLNKINFNGRVMPSLEASLSIPQEIISRISQAATYLALSKKIADISNTRKLPTGMMYENFTNY